MPNHQQVIQVIDHLEAAKGMGNSVKPKKTKATK